MKSIKQQYIDLTEGRMSQANFMRNLRMMMPQHITNVTSFNDSVKILKNKGILSEAEMKKYTDKEIQAKYNEMFGRNPQTKFADVAKALGISEDEVNMALRSMTPSGMSMPMREAKDEKTKWTNTSGKSMYDQFSEINNLNGQEVLIGIDAEMEKNHELTKEEATKIVIKNLKKNPIYYTAEYMSGVEGYEPEYLGGKSAQPEARQMQPLDKNMGNVVDKKMGMQPVKDVEKAKKDSDRVFIVSSDKDYLQLINEQIIVYRPIEKEFFTEDTVKNKFNLYPYNFIIYKTLLGDQSDSLPGIKGLGAKKLFKLFPELSDKKLSLDDIFELSQERIKEHIIYARILSDIQVLEDKYKIMDLSNPMIDDESKIKLLSLVKDISLEYHPEEFIRMYREDQIDGLIKNVEFWLKNNFQNLIQ